MVDEAYAEFSDGPSAIKLLADPRPQADRLPHDDQGVRLRRRPLGYLAAAPAVVDALQLVRLPYHLSVAHPGCRARRAASTPRDARSVALLRANATGCGGAGRAGYDVVPSDANFVLFGRFADAPRAWQAFLDRGVLIRDVGIPGRLRVTIGTPEENDAFLRCARTF